MKNSTCHWSFFLLCIICIPYSGKAQDYLFKVIDWPDTASEGYKVYITDQKEYLVLSVDYQTVNPQTYGNRLVSLNSSGSLNWNRFYRTSTLPGLEGAPLNFWRQPAYDFYFHDSHLVLPYSIFTGLEPCDLDSTSYSLTNRQGLLLVNPLSGDLLEGTILSSEFGCEVSRPIVSNISTNGHFHSLTYDDESMGNYLIEWDESRSYLRTDTLLSSYRVAGRWIRNVFNAETNEMVLFGGDLNDLSLNLLFLSLDGTLNLEIKIAENILEPDNGKIIKHKDGDGFSAYWFWDNDSYFANIDGNGTLVATRKFENRIFRGLDVNENNFIFTMEFVGPDSCLVVVLNEDLSINSSRLYEISGIVGLDIAVGTEGEFAITGYLDDMQKRNSFLLKDIITPFVATCTDLEIFPNPATEFLSIASIGNEQNPHSGPFNMKLYDCTGRIVQESQIFEETYNLDVRNLMSGIYFLQIFEDGEGSYCLQKKIVIQH